MAVVAHLGLTLSMEQGVAVARDLETLRTPVRVAESASGVEGEGGGEQVGGRHTEGQIVGDEKQRNFYIFYRWLSANLSC